jgi:hypothetical protein
LLPPATDHASRALWLHSTLADLVQAGATAEVLELDQGSIDTGNLPDELWTELGYRLQLAEAAVIRGEIKLADAALARARALSCQIATQSADTRDQWSAFLRRAYLLKAFREGRVPAHAVTARAL